MALSKFTTITIGTSVAGSVSFGSPDQAGNRSFTFTPTGGTAQEHIHHVTDDLAGFLGRLAPQN